MACLDADTVLELVCGRLSAARAREVEAHLDACAACRKVVSETAASQSPVTEKLDPASADTAVGPVTADPLDPSLLPIVPHDTYTRLEEFARGGLGRIVRARDRRTGRIVAIKEILGDHQDAAARFVREALVTANLQHPAIVPVYEVGRWPDGQPFYAMKLVRGQPLGDRIDACKDLDARLSLVPHVIAIADALAYAHGEGVIHRDLKPHNVLVGDFGETVVIDWGLARRASADDPAAPTLIADGGRTVLGAVMGTPAYMAPEQARGERVDERADVYAIGAILYRALAGRSPYSASTTDELIASVKHGPPEPLAKLVAAAPPDLLAIVERAMARDAAHRYPSAAELAADLRRFANGQLVRAHRYTRVERVRRFVARHRTAVGVAAFAIVVLAVVAGVSVRNIIAARRRADAEAAEARHHLAATYVDRARVELGAEHPDRSLAFAAAAAELDSNGPDLRFAAARALDALPEVHRLARSQLAAIAFVPGTHDLVAASAEGVVRWQPERNATVWTLPGPARDAIVLDAHTFVAAGDTIAVASLDDGKPIARIATPAAHGAPVVDPDHHWLAFATADRGFAIYDLSTRQVVATQTNLDLDEVVVVGPDGEHVVGKQGSGLHASLVLVDRAGKVTPLCQACWLAQSAFVGIVWVGERTDHHGQSLAVADWTGKLLRETPIDSDGLPSNLVIEPKYGLAVVASSSGWLGLYVLASGKFRGTRYVRDVPHAMLFDGADRFWVLGLYNGLTVFDLSHGLELGRWRADGTLMRRSDDGAAIATASASQITWWRAAPPPVTVIQPTGARVSSIAFTDANTLLAADASGALAEYDVSSHSIVAHGDSITALQPLAGGEVLVATSSGDVTIRDRKTAHAAFTLQHVATQAAAASPDAALVATGDYEGTIELWDRRSAAAVARVSLPTPIERIRWSSDGKLVAAIATNGATVICDRAGTVIRSLPAAPPAATAPLFLDEAHQDLDDTPTAGLVFSPDGRWLATGTGLHETTAHGRDVPFERADRVLAVAFSHDGSRVLAAGGGHIDSYDVATHARHASIATNSEPFAAQFSADDHLIFSGGLDHRLRAWDADTGAEYTGFDTRTPILSIAVSPDGTQVAATTANAALRWTLPPLAVPTAQLPALAACRAGVTVVAGNVVEAPPRCP